MPLTPFSGTLDKKGVAHLLRRATFGASPQQINSLIGSTPAAIVSQLFGSAIPDPALPIDPTNGEQWTTLSNPSSKNDDLENNFLSWYIGQMLNSSLPYSAREKIVFFLHTHFTTIRSKVTSAKALYFQNQLYRKFALDSANAKLSIKELTKKVSIDNAMIRLLDGDLNVKGNPNENYARELLELYSIGRGLDGYIAPVTQQGDYANYSETDIQIAARVLSGWQFDDTFTTIDADTLLPRASVRGSATNASSHDNDATAPKTFSSHFGGITIAPDPLLLSGGNPTEASAMDELDQLIEMIYAQHETAKNICRKVYRFFVYHYIDDVIDNDIIESMATVFESNNFKLQPLLTALFTSEHFYQAASGVDDDNFGGIIKSPLDLAIGTLRLFDYQLPDITTATADFYAQTSYLLNLIKGEGNNLAQMKMPFFDPTDVAGYEAYHQYPIYHRAWITPNHLASRYKFIENLILYNPTSPPLININVYTWVKANISDAIAGDENAIAFELAKYFFPVPYVDTETTHGLTDARLTYFKSQLIGLHAPGYWATLWAGGAQEDLRIALNLLFNAMLQTPEYQLS